MSIPEATRPGLEADVPAIIHEEVDRLPDRHRLPLLLCDLEGLTYEQAAGRLRWTEPTLRHRLVQARAPAAGASDSPRRHGGRGRPGRVGGRGESRGPERPGPRGGRRRDGRGELRRRPPP